MTRSFSAVPYDDRSGNLQNDLPKVYLVGAGPGDPGLLTQKGADILGRADVVLYDHLIALELLDLAPPHAERIDVGKIRSHPRMTQNEIESTMISHALEGKVVVRLKGGDPFVFGRGGEEAQALKKAGVPFAIVPGISSSIAVPAYAGVPVTHRDHNSRLVILTAHDDPSKWTPDDIFSLTRPNQTLVVLMGVLYMNQLVARLAAGGLSPETPVLLTRWGTTSQQESFQKTLGTVSGFLDTAQLSPPVTMVIGGVVSLREEIEWVHRLPLFGKRILLTRERDRSSDLSSTLQTLGATVISCPTIKISPRLSPGAKEKIGNPGSYSWILFLSPNGVRFFFEQFVKCGKDLRSLAGVCIFSMGPATTEALEQAGIIPDLVPATSHGAGVVEAFSSLNREGGDIKPVLIVRGDRGSGLIPEGLTKLSFEVDTIGVYENTLSDIPSYKKSRIDQMLEEGVMDLAIYYSPSAFYGLMEHFPDRADRIQSLPSVAIGPTTQTALLEGGVKKISVSPRPTSEGVVDAALDFLCTIRNNS